jgi:hypothetical protein
MAPMRFFFPLQNAEKHLGLGRSSILDLLDEAIERFDLLIWFPGLG